MSIYEEVIGKPNPTKKQQQWIEDIETAGIVTKSAKKAIEAFQYLQRKGYDLAFAPVNNVDGSYVIIGEKYTPPPQQSMSNSVKKKFQELDDTIKFIGETLELISIQAGILDKDTMDIVKASRKPDSKKQY